MDIDKRTWIYYSGTYMHMSPLEKTYINKHMYVYTTRKIMDKTKKPNKT